MTQLMRVPYLPTEADLSSLPRIVAAAIVSYNRAFAYYSKHAKIMKFYRAINGTGMKAEDETAMQKAIASKGRAEHEMWLAFDEKEKIVNSFNNFPDNFWYAEQLADEEIAADGISYVDECAEMQTWRA